MLKFLQFLDILYLSQLSAFVHAVSPEQNGFFLMNLCYELYEFLLILPDPPLMSPL